MDTQTAVDGRKPEEWLQMVADEQKRGRDARQ